MQTDRPLSRHWPPGTRKGGVLCQSHQDPLDPDTRPQSATAQAKQPYSDQRCRLTEMLILISPPEAAPEMQIRVPLRTASRTADEMVACSETDTVSSILDTGS